MIPVRFFDGTRVREAALSIRGTDAEAMSVPPGGLISGKFTDHHVHLQLVDAERLRAGVIGRVWDLGGNRARSADLDTALAPIRVAYAGQLLTAPGGYPSDRPWAADGWAREILHPEDAVRAFEEQVAAGATIIKAVAHADAGPLLADASFRTLAELARGAGMPLIAHAEGTGQAQRAVRLGATMLAHAPFTERLTDDEIAEQAEHAAWISTISIHTGAVRATVIDNVRRFAAAGGVVRYGTDLGNGDLPVGLNLAELDALREAGLDDAQLLDALAPLPGAPRDLASLLHLPGGDPARAETLPAGSICM